MTSPAGVTSLKLRCVLGKTASTRAHTTTLDATVKAVTAEPSGETQYWVSDTVGPPRPVACMKASSPPTQGPISNRESTAVRQPRAENETSQYRPHGTPKVI